MRVLCSTTSGFGHWMPLVPVAEALIEAGHEVRFAAPESGAEPIRARGFTVDAFDDASALAGQQERFDEAQRSGDPAQIEQVVMLGFGLVYPTAALPRMAATIVEYSPDLVIRDPAEFAGRVLGHKHGIPTVAAMGGLQGALAMLSAMVTEPLGTLREQQGLPAGSDPMDDALLMTATPDGFDTPGNPGAAPVARYRIDVPRDVAPDDDPPLVYATLGTEVFRQGMELGNRIVSTIAGAIADLPVRCLLTVGRQPPGDLPELPDNMSTEEFADHRQVVPRASVVITHGGAGTVQDALLMGRPMVVLPQFADQFLNAARVTEVGVGIGLMGEDQSVEQVRDAIGRALDGDFNSAVNDIAVEAAALPDLSQRVHELEALAAPA